MSAYSGTKSAIVRPVAADKIDSKLDNALVILSQSLNISKNKLIEDILFESGILQEVDENYMEQE